MVTSSISPERMRQLRERYSVERDRRLRPDGQAQYLRASGDLAAFADADPYAAPEEPREPLRDLVDVVIVGAGFGGILAAAALLEAGVANIRIVEFGGDFGGTWYWNRYPGAQCDVESYVYLPLLEETGYVPRERYSYAPEIFEHVQRMVDHFDLRPRAVFQTRVESATWLDDEKVWRIDTHRGDRFRARFVVTATGHLVTPKLPGIPGIASFAGAMFHTARWDYSYTGGDHRGGLTGLRDKRVAVIGTGATGVQVIPIVARDARHLYVFQRTPASVGDRGNAPTDPAWAASLTPGWQRRRQINLDRILAGEQGEESQVLDGWTAVAMRTNELLAEAGPGGDREALAEIADAEYMEEIRRRVDATIADPRTREALKPWYRYACKRIAFHDDYIATFNRPNVTLVDTSPSRGVEEIRPSAVVANGVEHEVDCIIFATGFDAATTIDRRLGMEVVGVGGRVLREHWAAGMRTLYGQMTHGFPNWFYIGPTQTAAANYSGTGTSQARLIAEIIRTVRERGADGVEPTADAEQAWVDEVARYSHDVAAAYRDCTPSYRNGEGQKTQDNIYYLSYGRKPSEFEAMIAAWIAAGDLPGTVFHRAGELAEASRDA